MDGLSGDSIRTVADTVATSAGREMPRRRILSRSAVRLCRAVLQRHQAPPMTHLVFAKCGTAWIACRKPRLRLKMEFQLYRRFRLGGSELPLLYGIDCGIHEQRVATHHFHVFHLSVRVDDDLNLHRTRQIKVPGERGVNRRWVLDGLTFFLRTAGRCGGERQQHDASGQGDHSSRSKTVEAHCSSAAHEHSIWFASEEENGTKAPMILSLRTVCTPSGV